MDDTPRPFVRLEAGTLVERDVLNVVQKIQEYDPNLKIQFLNPNTLAGPGDAPYRLLERCRDGEYRVVFFIWKLDDRVIDRLRRADTQRVDILATLDDNNLKARLAQKKRYEDRMDEAQDIVEHVIKSPKGRYTIPSEDGEGLVKIDDTKPSERVDKNARRIL